MKRIMLSQANTWYTLALGGLLVFLWGSPAYVDCVGEAPHAIKPLSYVEAAVTQRRPRREQIGC